MPNVNWDGIRTFLKDSGAPDDLAEQAMFDAGKLFLAYDDGRRTDLFDHAQASDDARATFFERFLPSLAEKVRVVTGRAVGRTILVSAAQPIPRQPWMTESAYEQHHQFRLDDGAQEILEDSTDPKFVDAVEMAQAEPLDRVLHAVARERDFALRWGTIDFDRQQDAGLTVPLGWSWRSVCFRRLDHALESAQKLATSLYGGDDALCVHVVLQHLFAFAIVGDRERTAQFAELASDLAFAIPIGWKKDEPDVLLIRVA